MARRRWNDPVVRLHRSASRRDAPPVGNDRAGAHLAGAHLDEQQVRALTIWIAAAPIVLAVAAAALGAVATMVAAFTLIAVPSAAIARQRRRRSSALIEALPEGIEAIARSLRSGAPLVQAIAEAGMNGPGPTRAMFAGIVREVDNGRSLPAALRGLTNDASPAELRIVAGALALSSEHESGAGRSIDGIAQALRDRAAVAAEVRTHAAQAVSSMLAMVFLPMAFLMLDALGSQRSIQFLTGDPIGRSFLVAGVGLDLAGWMWMRSVMRRRLPS